MTTGQSVAIYVGITIFGGLIVYLIIRRNSQGQGVAYLNNTLTPTGLTQKDTFGHKLTGGTGDYLRKADNLATSVCPAVGAYFGVSAGSASQGICDLSRKLDPVYYITDYGSKLLDKL